MKGGGENGEENSRGGRFMEGIKRTNCGRCGERKKDSESTQEDQEENEDRK